VVIADDPERFRLRAFTNTTLQIARVHVRGITRPLWLKLELGNPTGSIKFRTAIGLLADLAAQFPIRPGTRVVESTSGNLGLAMGRLLSEANCQFVAVIDPKVTPRMRHALQAEGACVVLVSEPDIQYGYLVQRLRKVHELMSEDSTLRWTDQYHSQANPAIHRDATATEILRQTDGAVDMVLAAVSTGGTLAGLSAGLRARRPGIHIRAVDAHGSLVTSDTSVVHLLTGIGAARKSDFLHDGTYDSAVRVRDVEAFAFCRMLAEDTGLAVGGSAGAVVAAFTQLVLDAERSFHCPVAVIADGGDNYCETIYSDNWLRQQSVLDQVQAGQARARTLGVFFELHTR
jgi:cysteine synthase A